MLGLFEAALSGRHASTEAKNMSLSECERVVQLISSLERPHVAVTRLAAETYRILFTHAPELISSSSLPVDATNDVTLFVGLRVGAALVVLERQLGDTPLWSAKSQA